jgi:hypothetical protein
MYGAIEFFEGSFVYMEQEEGRFDSNGYIKYLQKLLKIFSKPIFLIEDSARYHVIKAVNKFKNE